MAVSIDRMRTPLVAVLAAAIAACGGKATTPQPTAGDAGSATPASQAPTSTPAPTESPGTSAPAPRSAAAMAWDPASENILLFGGATSTGLTNTLDAWDGAAWTRLTSEGPPARDDAQLVADAGRGVVVLHGGRSGQTPLVDTWEWDGNAWRQLDDAGPEPRAHAVAAFDHEAGRLVLYGGVGADDTAFADTWSWDGATWKKLDDRGIDGRVPTGMAWDPVDERVVMLAIDLQSPNEDGTYVSELWAWTGGLWQRVAGGGPAFSPLQSFVEGPRHPWLIDGGAAQGRFGTWEWTGDAGQWTEVDGAAPEPRNGQAVAFDAKRHQMVLFGGFAGSTDFGDTWVLTEGAWREVE